MGFDDWLFRGDPEIITRAEKASGYFLARREQHTKFLVFWRISCLIYFAVTEVYYWFIRLEEWGPPIFYITNQGHYLYGLFNLLALSGYIRHRGIGEPLPTDSGSPWFMWKWVSALFNMLITLQIWIVILFWIIWIFWEEGEKEKEDMYNVVTKHAMHLALLLVDAGLNKLIIEYNHWALIALYTLASNLLLILARFGFSYTPYPFASYD